MNFYSLQLLKKLGFKKFFYIALLSILASIFELFGIGSIGPFINIVNDPSSVSDSKYLQYFIENFDIEVQNILFYFGLTLIFIFIFINFYKAGLFYLQTKIALNYSAQMSVSLFKKYLENEYYFYLIRNSNELAKNIFSECQLIGNDIIKNALVILSQVIIAIFIISFCIYLNPVLGFSMILFGVSYYLLIYGSLKKWLKRFGESQLFHSTNRWRIISESFNSIKEVKVFNFSKHLENFFLSETNKWTNNKISYALVGTLPRFLIEVIGVIFLVSLTLYLINFENEKNVISFIAVYSFAILRLFPVLQQIYMAFTSLKGAQSRIKLIYEDLNNKKLSHSKKNKINLKLNNSIEFKDINYKYQKGNFQLKNISIKINEGEIIGITGQSGSGKSSFVDLLLGLLIPQSGNIYIDNKEIGLSDYSSYKKNFSYVPQDVFIFADTLKNNLTFDFENNSPNETLLKKTIKISNLSNFINNLEKGLETPMHDKGIDISGGQKQRIGIARAIYSNRKITIFDESTSSLDSETELEIMRQIEENKKDKIFVIISHKKSTLKFCDKIAYFKNGEIEKVSPYNEKDPYFNNFSD